MKIFIEFENEKDLQLVADFNATQEKVILNDIKPENFEEDIKRRIDWVITSKLNGCLDRLIDKWLPLIKERYQSIPTNELALAELIFSQPEYKPFYELNKESENVE